jgi:hypothetical protein
LRALLRDHLGTDDVGEPSVFALGAAIASDDAVWFLVDGDASRSLGPCLAVALKMSNANAVVNVLAERDTGILARRAAHFARDIRVWHVDDRAMLPAVEEPYLPRVSAPPEHLALGALIERCGASVVVEHGVVVGEVDGLEICRVVTDSTTGETRLEVGVGAHDREAFALVHGHLPTDDALRSVVAAVAVHRRDGAHPHPLNSFGAERLMRARAIAHPQSIGMTAVHSSEPPMKRTNIKDAVPCVASGTDASGNSVVVTFVHGADLDVVPFAVDAQQYLNPSARIFLVARLVDVTPSIRALAELCSIPIEIVEPS